MNEEKYYTLDALEYISKLSDGGLRDSLTMLDKCISYSTDLTLDNVVNALGAVNYGDMFKLNDCIFEKNLEVLISAIENIHRKGHDLKQFLKQYMLFQLDVVKFGFLDDFEYLQIPELYKEELDTYGNFEYDVCGELLTTLIELNGQIKWETSPKAMIEAGLILFIDKCEAFKEE